MLQRRIRGAQATRRNSWRACSGSMRWGPLRVCSRWKYGIQQQLFAISAVFFSFHALMTHLACALAWYICFHPLCWCWPGCWPGSVGASSEIRAARIRSVTVQTDRCHALPGWQESVTCNSWPLRWTPDLTLGITYWPRISVPLQRKEQLVDATIKAT